MRLNYLQKIIAARESALFFALAQDYRKLAAELRTECSRQMGDCGGVNPYPVSGGICEHWHRWQKDAVCYAVRRAQDLEDASLKEWQKCGRRAHTWRAMRESYVISTRNQ